ncbi:MAG TPA: BMC domain-containing protein [Negativicutes bacterium]|nr:BMC domain-containing protein [Negativicutes bacterium]
MPRLALGLIETVGLAAAIEAADAAAKSANITIVGYELTKGGGLVTVKLEGDVGAVKSAVAAGCAAAMRVNKVFCKQVIPRPHEELTGITNSVDTISASQPLRQEAGTVMLVPAEAGAGYEYSESTHGETQESDHTESVKGLLVEPDDEIREYCNLCLDPLCPRKKGELRSTCIHYTEYKEVL